MSAGPGPGGLWGGRAGQEPPGLSMRAGIGGGASRDSPSPDPRPPGRCQSGAGTGIMTLVISVYPVEVTVLPVTGAGDPGQDPSLCQGWAGAPAPARVYRGLGPSGIPTVPDSSGCPAATLLCGSLPNLLPKGK